ncbi:hypothetical protein [Flindersiella endophytica]
MAETPAATVARNAVPAAPPSCWTRRTTADPAGTCSRERSEKAPAVDHAAHPPGQQRADALQGEHRAGLERGQAVLLLEVQRDQEQRAVQGDACEEEGGGGRAERPVCEQPDRDRGPLPTRKAPGDERRQQGETAG